MEEDGDSAVRGYLSKKILSNNFSSAVAQCSANVGESKQPRAAVAMRQVTTTATSNVSEIEAATIFKATVLLSLYLRC